MATIRGGDKLEAALKAISEKVSKPCTLRVGFLEGATYPDGTPVAMVAALDEFGHGKTPPRPFFRTLVASKSPTWGNAIEENLVAKNYDVEATMKVAGRGIADQLQQSIIETNSPALSPVTLMLRKMFGNHPEEITGRSVGEAARRVAAGESTEGVSTKPLEWTGHMLNSVDFEVKS